MFPCLELGSLSSSGDNSRPLHNDSDKKLMDITLTLVKHQICGHWFETRLQSASSYRVRLKRQMCIKVCGMKVEIKEFRSVKSERWECLSFIHNLLVSFVIKRKSESRMTNSV